MHRHAFIHSAIDTKQTSQLSSYSQCSLADCEMSTKFCNFPFAAQCSMLLTWSTHNIRSCLLIDLLTRFARFAIIQLIFWMIWTFYFDWYLTAFWLWHLKLRFVNVIKTGNKLIKITNQNKRRNKQTNDLWQSLLPLTMCMVTGKWRMNAYIFIKQVFLCQKMLCQKSNRQTVNKISVGFTIFRFLSDSHIFFLSLNVYDCDLQHNKF